MQKRLQKKAGAKKRPAMANGDHRRRTRPERFRLNGKPKKLCYETTRAVSAAESWNGYAVWLAGLPMRDGSPRHGQVAATAPASPGGPAIRSAIIRKHRRFGPRLIGPPRTILRRASAVAFRWFVPFALSSCRAPFHCACAAHAHRSFWRKISTVYEVSPGFQDTAMVWPPGRLTPRGSMCSASPPGLVYVARPATQDQRTECCSPLRLAEHDTANKTESQTGTGSCGRLTSGNGVLMGPAPE
jgi:hypothetical protein